MPFGSDGALSPAITETDLSGVTVDGVAISNIKLNFGTGGIDPVQRSERHGGRYRSYSQNGFPAGQYTSVAINDSGRVVVS